MPGKEERMAIPTRSIFCKCGKMIQLQLVSAEGYEIFEGSCDCGLRLELHRSNMIACTCGKNVMIELVSTDEEPLDMYEGECACGVKWTLSRARGA